MNQTAYKICPRCKETSALSASLCSQCGRLFKTTAPQNLASNQTIVAMVASAPTSPIARRRRINVKAAFPYLVLSGMALGSFAIIYAVFLRRPHPLIGHWVRRIDLRPYSRVVSETHLYLASDKTYREISDGVLRREGKWFTRNETRPTDDSWGGDLGLGNGFDYIPYHYIISDDRRFLRLLYGLTPDVYEDFVRADVLPPLPDLPYTTESPPFNNGLDLDNQLKRSEKTGNLKESNGTIDVEKLLKSQNATTYGDENRLPR